MPQLYNNAVITDAGLSLLDKVQAGTALIQFTRMATGNGTYTVNEKTSSALKRCTGLKVQRNSYPPSSVSTVPDGGVKLTTLITNQDPATGATLVSEGYYINEIGLFAKEKDGDSSTEVLYSITVARGDNGDYMPPYETGAPVQIVQEYHAKVGNATEVAISCTGAVMLVEDAQREFEELKRMIGEAGAIEEKTLTFEEAETRENIASGDRTDTILGKIRKFFADLKRVAFTASYNDLIDKPDIPSVPSSLPADGGNAESVGGKDLDYIMDYNNLDNRPHLFSGDYADLQGKPDIPSAPADIGAVGVDDLAVKRYVVPKPATNEALTSISWWDVAARRTGNVVELRVSILGEMMKGDNTSTVDISTLPEEYRPKDGIVVQEYPLIGGGTVTLLVRTDGRVSLQNAEKHIYGYIYRQSVVYIVD